MAYTVGQYGITGHIRQRRRGYATDTPNLDINSVPDSKPIRLNSRDYSSTSGSQIGVQIKPNIIVDNSSEHTGLEVSPRLSDAAGSLLGLNVAPLLKTASAPRAVATMKCIELNPGLPGSGSAYTVTQLDGIRAFLDNGVGHTVTTSAVIRVATPNNGAWDYFLVSETNSGIVATSAGAQDTTKWIKVLVGATVFKIPLYATA